MLILRIVWISMLMSTLTLMSAWGSTAFVDGSADGDLDRRASERFFRDHKQPVEFRREGKQIWLANRRVGLEITEGANGFSLSRLFDVNSGTDFLADRSATNVVSLWQLVFRKDKGRDARELVLSSSAGASLSVRAEEKADAITLHLDWKGLELAAERQCVDVTVTATLQLDDPISRWRISVSNRSTTWGLWNVRFPTIELAPIGDPDRNRFLLAHSGGMISKDPFGQPIKTLYDWENKYPEWINMQFQALYHEDGRGLYLATHDGTGCRKTYRCESKRAKKTIEYSVETPPPDMGFPAENFALPYDVCLGPFRGDWYDACQIYRAWAMQQVWCSKGTLAVRQDIPRWFKENPYIFVLYSNEKGGEAVPAYRDQIIGLMKYLGTGLPVNWYCWKKYLPEFTGYNSELSDFKVPTKASAPCGNEHDGNYPALPAWSQFAPACDAIARAGGFVNAYVCSSLYDPGLRGNAPFAAQAVANACKDVSGKPIWGEGVDVSYRMCPHADWWVNRMKETAVALIKKDHVRGIYFDTFFGGMPQCWDKGHGHAAGGGNEAYLGDRKLSASVRGAMKQADSEATMVGECPCETAIDLLDGFLTWHTLQAGEVPLWSTVYGDYIPRQGMWLAPTTVGFYAQAATLFTERTQLGRITLAHNINYLDARYSEQMAFLKKLGDYWRSESGVKYMAYGRLLRPLEFVTPAPMPVFRYQESADDIGSIEVPVLYSCVLESVGGSLGVFVINVSTKPQAIRFELKPGRYPIADSKAYQTARKDEKGNVVETKVEKGKVTFAGTIGGHDLLFLDIDVLR
jgi:hypothetical protein